MTMKANQTIGKTPCTKCGKASCSVAYWSQIAKKRPTDSNLKSKEQAVRHCNQDAEDADQMESVHANGQKVTVYFKGAIGLSKKEGTIVSVDKDGVNFIAKRAKRTSTVMSYYSPFWMVVAGWGTPDPDDVWDKANASTTAGGATVTKAKYRSTDPRWVEDFLAGAGQGLRVLAMLRDGSFTNPGNLAPPATKHESLRRDIEDLGVLLGV